HARMPGEKGEPRWYVDDLGREVYDDGSPPWYTDEHGVQREIPSGPEPDPDEIERNDLLDCCALIQAVAADDVAAVRCLLDHCDHERTIVGLAKVLSESAVKRQQLDRERLIETIEYAWRQSHD